MRLEQARQHVKVQRRRVEVQHAPFHIHKFPILSEPLNKSLQDFRRQPLELVREDVGLQQIQVDVTPRRLLEGMIHIVEEDVEDIYLC